MSEENSTTSHHLSVAKTTAQDMVTRTAAGDSQAGSFYFQCAVVVTGLIGTATNALILYAMLAAKQYKKHVLIFHQNFFDFVTSFFLAFVYALKMCNLQLEGASGYWLCMALLSENPIWSANNGSVVNLAVITIVIAEVSYRVGQVPRSTIPCRVSPFDRLLPVHTLVKLALN